MFASSCVGWLLASKRSPVWLIRLHVTCCRYQFYAQVVNDPEFRSDEDVAKMFAQPLVAWWKGQNFIVL